MSNRRLTQLCCAAILAAGTPLAAQESIRGFPADALAAQRQRESDLRAVPSRDSLRARMRLLSEHPHEAGTERSRQVADLILARFRSFGLDAKIERFEALMPRPVARTVELLAPERYAARLAEPRLADDKDSGDPNQLPSYNAYSPDGDVTAELVYVNYGLPDDYRVLDSLGIDVRGKIVIARYGRSWRGIKPKLAAEHGAVGCIIYSDPHEDGYFVDDVYPEGPMRPEHGVQRGSVMDMPTYPGDPLTPGWGATPGSRKLARSEVKTFSPIPVLPISYGDALPFLRALDGPVPPEEWRGHLPITYHVGPGPARVRLAVQFEWEVRPLFNVIATVRGAQLPEEWIVYGNHHDAWVNGAEDPISGMVALEETARAVGTLLRSGWRPARTIIFAAWDGEEWGLLGSTEWAEQHAADLRANAVAYLNSDTNGRGWLGIAGSHSLQRFAEELVRDIRQPDTSLSALDAIMKRRRETKHRDSTEYTIAALGSGSDYTAFIDHLGLASLNISWGGGSEDGIYHSIYDSFDHYTRFNDTTFAFGVAEAGTLGTAILRLADAVVLPYEFGAAVKTYRGYVDEIEKEARKSDTTRALDLGAVRAALSRLDSAATAYERVLSRLDATPTAKVRSRARQLATVNRLLLQTERALTDSAGLPGREWYRHLLYAPGFYTGYGVKTMPGIREAVEDRPNLAVAQREAGRVAAAIDRLTSQVRRATSALDEALR
ncbi:MAG TPA: transferrin receptor-like dimerization domain-containing protein [Gemmatimonadaceae bacterium]|nr:transferrin receptor-like dimerization domain-containing protein [Gemmatimonadaceae bacterium]